MQLKRGVLGGKKINRCGEVPIKKRTGLRGRVGRNGETPVERDDQKSPRRVSERGKLPGKTRQLKKDPQRHVRASKH